MTNAYVRVVSFMHKWDDDDEDVVHYWSSLTDG
jgi:hypothetical protein